MDHLIFQIFVFCTSLCFGLFENQGNNVIQALDFKVSTNLAAKQLSLEWDFGNDSETFSSENKMVLNIQIYQSEEDNIVCNENYTTTLNQILPWNWKSKVPLECVKHGVRIRSRDMNLEVWRSWSPWKIVDGLEALDERESYIRPDNEITQEGSNVTFCCIARKNEMVTHHVSLDGKREKHSGHRRITFIERNVKKTNKDGFNAACSFSGQKKDHKGTLLLVTRQPDQPKNLECETEDLNLLKCTCDPGDIDSYRNLEGKCPLNFTLLDKRSNLQTYCNVVSQKVVCVLKLDKRTIYNLTLISQNCLGQATIHHFVDVTQRVRPAAPSKLSVNYQNATTIHLYWLLKNIKETLLCQINKSYLRGEEQYDVIVQYHIDSQPNISLSLLQPYTNYTFKIRCGAYTSFWKWSEWSKSITIQTNESAPSGQLDIWRDIEPGLEKTNVTVFWKTTPGFRANGKIQTYEIFWHKLEEPIVNCFNESIPALNNSTIISVDTHTYKISVSARNSINTSDPSLMIISMTRENGNIPDTEEDTINNTTHGIFLMWKPQDKYDGYIVDWCNYPKSHSCDFQWNKFGPNVSSTVIVSDAFSPGVRYTFRVYGRKGAETYILEKKTKYLEELEPTRSLNLQISEVTSSSFTVTWEPYPMNESQPGFIRGYTVYVKMDYRNCTLRGSEPNPDSPGECTYTIKNPKQKSFIVRDLEPSTTYMAAVQAYSVKPKNNPDNYKTAVTQADGNWALYFLMLGIIPLKLIICACCSKIGCVQDHLFPKIPRPAVSPFVKMTPSMMEIICVNPDELVVMEKHQCSIHKDPPLKMLMLENMTYQDSSSYQNLYFQETTNKECNSDWIAYKPLQDFGFMNHSTTQPPKKIQYSITYVSQTHLPPFNVQEDDLASPPTPDQQSVYKPQVV